jgi:UDP-2,3-diacylglucosamine pyrophosphatase LpxH
MFSKVTTHDLRHWCRLAVLLLMGTFHSYGQRDIAFISDTQAPMWVEKIVLKSNNNIQATALAFNDILKKRPSSLFILGDVVTLGYKEKKWSRMDVYLDSCRKAGIHVSALLGNHDVMTRSNKGESQFQRRFPNHNRTGFYQIVDSIAVIFLNSNFSKLSHEDLDAQQVWFQNTLNAFDSDPAIVITVVACHHAPFSNSKIVGSSQSVQEHFVPAFVKSRKAQLFITGHSHNYEQFKYMGKDFLVIGGGGGLTQPLSKENKLTDISSSYKPQFHYLVVQRNQQTLCLTSRYLKDDFSGFEDGLSYSLSVH